MKDRDATAKAPKLSQIRKLIYGDRLDVLERRIEILARNLGQEVTQTRNELVRRLEPLEGRLEAFESERGQELEGLQDRLRSEIVEGQEREAERRESLADRLGEQLGAHRDQLSSDLKAAINAAVTAREGLVARLRVEVERAREAGSSELENLGQALRDELARLRGELASTRQLSQLFSELSRKLDGADRPGDEGAS